MLATHHLALHEDKVGRWDLRSTWECPVRQRGLSQGPPWTGDLSRGPGRGLGLLQQSRGGKHLVAKVQELLVLTFFLLTA